MISFRLATEEDARRVGGSLREVDRLEIERGFPEDPQEAPVGCVKGSIVSWAALDAGIPIAVFGVAPHPSRYGVGVVWFLGTEGVERKAREFMLKGRYYVDLMSKVYPVLVNCVDSENTRTRRWLRHLGFTEGDPVIGRQTGHPFIPITFQRPQPCVP